MKQIDKLDGDELAMFVVVSSYCNEGTITLDWAKENKTAGHPIFHGTNIGFHHGFSLKSSQHIPHQYMVIGQNWIRLKWEGSY